MSAFLIPKVNLKVSPLEAAMIKKLREYHYGTFRITKLDGEPRRIIIEGSETLKEVDGLTIAEDVKD
jgi:hypothetical protein